ncbi:FecR family protein [Puteibacter caeruleilacunae]|nr:FecR family protein [Puteibacter caeruleilacunae]
MKAFNMEQKNIPWNEISAFLKREASIEQKQQLKDWLEASSDNTVIFDEILKTWEISNQGFSDYQPEEERLWGELMHRINYPGQKQINLKVIAKWLTAAAIITLVFLAGNWSGKSNFSLTKADKFTTVAAPSGNKTFLVLPDSTKVWLNSGAELKYSSAYAENNREVFIKGECFFDVTKSSENHFLVNTSNLRVKVFGTEFNVRENNKEQSTLVTLVSGKVQVLDRSNKELSVLQPNEQLIFEKNKFRIRKLPDVYIATAWMQNMLIFNNQSFEEIISYLENWFGVDIELHPSLAHKNYYTFKTKTESLREVLEMISIITPIDYEINGDKVKINPKK